MDGVAEQTVRLPGLVGGLPEVLAVVVLQLAQDGQRLVVGEEGGALAVGPLEGVDQIDDLVCRDGRASGGNGGLRPAGRRQQAQGLASAVPVEKGILLGRALANWAMM